MGTKAEPVDTYLPQNGNRGYRVSRYELELQYKVAANRLSGRVQITAVAAEQRARFALDLAQPMQVSKVLVNGRRAKYSHQRGKLTITPAQPVPAGGAISVVIAYGGAPQPIRGQFGEVGWEELHEGSMVANQPNGAASWFPCDDHPSSKSSYRISITTDSPFYAVANGNLVRKQVKASQTTWVYEQAEPMSSYLATVQIGRYERRRVSREPVPTFAVAPPRLRDKFDYDFGRQSKMMMTFQKLFGPYPFDEYTVVVTDDDLEIPIEAQGISIFGANHCDGRRSSERLVAHELAHQWFGNSLTVRSWRDIWLHEGFACYAEWLWSESSGGPTADQLARAARQNLARQRQDFLIGDPGPELMFDDRLYKRGALTLHALRAQLGDAKFVDLLQDWTTRYRHQSVSTDDFMLLAGRFSQRPLQSLWDGWLYTKKLPELSNGAAQLGGYGTQ